MSQPQQLTLHVDSMECGHCVTIIAAAVKEVPGVQTTDVDRTTETVTVHGADMDPAQLRQAIELAGYTVAG